MQATPYDFIPNHDLRTYNYTYYLSTVGYPSPEASTVKSMQHYQPYNAVQGGFEIESSPVYEQASGEQHNQFIMVMWQLSSINFNQSSESIYTFRSSTSYMLICIPSTKDFLSISLACVPYCRCSSFRNEYSCDYAGQTFLYSNGRWSDTGAKPMLLSHANSLCL